MLGSRAVGEHEADGYVIGCGVGGLGDGGVGDELEGHAGCIVDYAGEVLGDGRELTQTKEGQWGGVRAKLDAKARRGFASESGVELLEDLSRESSASDGADSVAGIVR